MFSNRKLEKATSDSIAFRYICVNTNPDHDTIASFRKRFLKELQALFAEILLLAQDMWLVKLGHVSLDGTKIKANTSEHKALSWEYASQLESQLKEEVEELLRLAEQADQSALPVEMDIPAELKRREARLMAITQAMEEILARAQACFECEQAAYEEKVARRQAYEEENDQKAQGKEPIAPKPGPQPKDKDNLTDEESLIMPSSSGGFE